MKEELNKGLINFLNHSHSEYHALKNVKDILNKEGFIELKENENWNLEKGKNYFVTRNLNSFIAFKVPTSIDEIYFSMVSGHLDSPTFKIKENPSVKCNGYEKLKVEGYGGMIISPWLDKPLSIAGRICYSSNNEINTKLVDIDKDLLIIPNCAIHQNREINNGYAYNIQRDILPIIGTDSGETNLFDEFLKSLVNKDEKILSYDLYLYNREKANFIGINDDFISSPKLDDLASIYVTLRGFIDSKNEDSIALIYGSDNEETGSLSYSGADGTFLYDVTSRIVNSFDENKDAYYKAIKKSFMISSDNAHAIHPNLSNLSDDINIVKINKGLVVKFNSNMNYTSDAFSSAFIKKIMNDNNIPYQIFFNRSDVRGGSTLGNISISHVGVLSVDVGLPQLAMHSNYETMGKDDSYSLYNLIKKFMSVGYYIEDGKVIFKEGK